MRAKQIGFLLCRLAAVTTVLWVLPDTVWMAIGFFHQREGDVRAEWIQTLVADVAMLFVASIVWNSSRSISKLLFDQNEPDGDVAVDGAQFAAIGLGLLGVGAAMAKVGAMVGAFTIWWMAVREGIPLGEAIHGRGGSPAALTQVVLGLAVLLLAPRTAVWLAMANKPIGVNGDDRA